MPKPTEAHRKLERLVGNGVGEEKMHPSPFDPKGGTATGRLSNRLALDGFAVVQDYEQERNGAIAFRGHGVFRYDAAEGAYSLHWYDSMGMAPNVFRGSFEGEVPTLACRAPQKTYRAVFEFQGTGGYSFRMEVSPDGKAWFPSMEGRYTRRP
ncbi:MAG: DUF1579 family protein [Planctomycetota bacterium]